ncbi:MAG TPA: MarR family transcriptional regulator [Gemmatimonadales bacterium]|nr:MarR family transcriptional regulator [Gemmatimonadales bacterium]
MRDSRTANLLGALVLALHDEMEAATTAAAEHGAAYPAALATILGAPGLTIEALRQILGLSHSGTVRLLDALEAEGSVVRKSGKDARSVAVELTASGRRQAQAVLRARETALGPALESLSAAERGQLLRLTEKLLASLTRNPQHADTICRLCDLGACPEDSCPVECAARGT